MTLIKDIAKVAQRSQSTLLQDVIGAAALCVLLVASLHIPHFV